MLEFVVADSKLTSFWTTLLDAKKQLFVSEKFLTVASEDGEQENSFLLFGIWELKSVILLCNSLNSYIVLSEDAI